MRDLNFFESFGEKKEFKLNKKLILYSLAVLILLALLGKGIMNHLQLSKLQGEVDQLREIAEDPATLDRVEKIKKQEDAVIQFGEEVEKIRALDALLEKENLITEDFLTRLTSRLPLDAFLTNLSLSPNEINITGIAKDRWDVADFSKSLEDLEEADKVFISDIKRESDYYEFNINLQLKDVNTDGE